MFQCTPYRYKVRCANTSTSFNMEKKSDGDLWLSGYCLAPAFSGFIDPKGYPYTDYSCLIRQNQVHCEI